MIECAEVPSHSYHIILGWVECAYDMEARAGRGTTAVGRRGSKVVKKLYVLEACSQTWYSVITFFFSTLSVNVLICCSSKREAEERKQKREGEASKTTSVKVREEVPLVCLRFLSS